MAGRTEATLLHDEPRSDGKYGAAATHATPQKGGLRKHIVIGLILTAVVLAGTVTAILVTVANGDSTGGDVPSPVFGHGMLKRFMFKPGYVNLNHGSYGSTPTDVHRRLVEHQQEMEASTDDWFRLHMNAAVDVVRARLASYLNVSALDLVFVPNASTGVNAVLRALRPPGDGNNVIISLSTIYPMVQATLDYVSEVDDWQLEQVELTWPPSDQAVLDAVEQKLQEMDGRTHLCVFSHITSVPAVVLPMKALTALCHAHGAMVLVDGAHVLGHIPLDIIDVGADFYLSNGHKWLFSPKGSSFLWVVEDKQDLIYPTVISGGAGETPFQRRFSWQGTNDYSAFLSIGDALDFRDGLPGGDKGVMEYTKKLAQDAGRRLSDMWGTETLCANAPLMQSSMVNVRLPLSPIPDGVSPGQLQEFVRERSGIWGPLFALNVSMDTQWYVRLSAQIFNELPDFEHYGQVVLSTIQEAPWENEERTSKREYLACSVDRQTIC